MSVSGFVRLPLDWTLKTTGFILKTPCAIQFGELGELDCSPKKPRDTKIYTEILIPNHSSPVWVLSTDLEKFCAESAQRVKEILSFFPTPYQQALQKKANTFLNLTLADDQAKRILHIHKTSTKSLAVISITTQVILLFDASQAYLVYKDKRLVLGKGNSGRTVYKCLGVHDFTLYACAITDIAHIKMVLNQESPLLFLSHEIEIMEKVNGAPGILRLYANLKEEEENFYVVMQIAKSDLKKAMEKELSLEQKIEIALGISQGLKSLHDLGIVHGDINPNNSLLRDTGSCLCDFGCAIKEDSSEKIKKQRGGTSAYLPPELAGHLDNMTELGDEGWKKNKTPKADIWALGCVFWNLFLGNFIPFQESKEGKFLDTIKNLNDFYDIEDPLSTTGVYSTLQILIAKMLKTNPEERLDANGVLEELSAVYDDLRNNNFQTEIK